MSLIRKEPAMVAGFVTAIVALLVVYGILDERQAAAWTAVLVVVGGSPIVQGFITRFLVFSPNTVDEMVEAGAATQDTGRALAEFASEMEKKKRASR